MKLTKLNALFAQAYEIAKLSPDAETKVGCIAVRDDMSVISSSYNGYIKGANDAILPSSRPQKYQYMIHAEQNLITTCAKHGTSLNGATVIVTLSPCIHCARLLFQSGVNKIYFKEEYKDFKKQLNMLDLKFNLTPVEDYVKIELEIQ